MKKILLILSLILCSTFEMYSNCICPEEMYVDGQFVPVYGTGQWQRGEPFEMVISTSPLLKVKVSYCYRVTNELKRQICINGIDYVFNEELTEEQMYNYLVFVDLQQRMLSDYAVFNLLFGEKIFDNTTLPFNTKNLPICPTMAEGVVEVFMSQCVVKQFSPLGHKSWTKYICGMRTYCQYEYSYCWVSANGITEIKQTRKVIYANLNDCPTDFIDPNGGLNKCVSADCHPDVHQFEIPEQKDFDNKITDLEFYKIR